jgi:purine-cytosine permease-like protein
LAATVLLLVRPSAGAAATIVAGITIIGFELVEIGVVGFTLIEYDASQLPEWLQVIYLALGFLQVLFGYRAWRRTGSAIPRISFAH